MVCGCGKEDKKTQKDPRFTKKQVEIKDNKPEYLLQGVTIGGLRINDTVNNIKAELLMPAASAKDFKYSLTPINKRTNEVFKDFVTRAKKEEKNDTVFNRLNIRTFFVNSKGNLISSLMESTEQLTGKEQTQHCFGITYRKNSQTPLTFKEVFPLNEEVFEDFRQIFGAETENFGLKDFETSEFAIGKDSLFVFIEDKESGKQSKISADILLIEAFMAHGK